MDMGHKFPTVWNQLADTMYLNHLPTAEVRISNVAPFSFARLRSDRGLPEIARPTTGESGYIVPVQLAAIPYIEQFFGKRKVSSGSYPTGGVSAIDLRDEPAVLLPHAFDTVIVYVTHGALADIAYEHRSPPVEQLRGTHGHPDPIVYHLAKTLSASLEHPRHASKIFLDHVLHALNCHLVSSYGGVKTSAAQFRGGLSTALMRRAKELLEANLDGNIPLRHLAEACGLSTSHYTRAFKETFRKPPHRWLIERRIDRAKDLMTNSHLPIADIAIQCGFADQSALNRSFRRIHGISPGQWRRATTRERGSASPRTDYSDRSAASGSTRTARRAGR
ncbi:helix-turn-helix domain-containing protein [Occallatibacter riparius]|uniref:AraC family transcriptional regulator n=1 Tax=Occallatibacter riparius TaxID=1002689 RepID=A0A9J7BPF7_9BACT|nr:AraC family transcriptional regulator [Occallatibacter riparius]UWZ83634.1 AraC family transcriptional regulator [Occallatibacter riparius]